MELRRNTHHVVAVTDLNSFLMPKNTRISGYVRSSHVLGQVRFFTVDGSFTDAFVSSVCDTLSR